MKMVVKRTIKKSKLDTHLSSSRSGKKKFSCDICGKSFTNRTKLAEHISAIHEEKKPFKCDISQLSKGSF